MDSEVLRGEEGQRTPGTYSPLIAPLKGAITGQCRTQEASKKIVSGGLYVVGGVVQGGIVMFPVIKCVINYINEDLGEPVFH